MDIHKDGLWISGGYMRIMSMDILMQTILVKVLVLILIAFNKLKLERIWKKR